MGGTQAAGQHHKARCGFSLAETFAWDTALDIEDDRKNYGESRRVAIGLVGPDGTF